MTDAYWTSVFPCDYLRTTWFPQMTGASDPDASGLVFRVQTQTANGYGDDIPSVALDQEMVQRFLIGGDALKRALHAYTTMDRPFAIDFDFAPPKSQTPDDLDAWWRHVKAEVRKLEIHLFMVISRRKVFGDTCGIEGAPEGLWCWSGNRGIHLYIHPLHKWHKAPAAWRKRLLEEAMEALAPEDKQWVDISASVVADSAKSLRVPFSPHVESPSHSVCLPLGTWNDMVHKMERHPLNLGMAVDFTGPVEAGRRGVQEAVKRMDAWLKVC